MTPRAPLSRWLVAILAGAVVLVPAVPAAAHVELEPEEATAGSITTLTFSFHHGLDGNPTTGLSVQMPPGTEVLDVPDKPGWEVEVEGDPPVVTWTGGEVPDGVEESFEVEVGLPDEAGEVLFPTIQDGPAGELAWLSAEGGETEQDNPAPRLVLVADPEATTTTEAPTTEAPTTTLGSGAVDEDATVVADDDAGVGWPVLVGGALVIALAVGAAVAYGRGRRGPGAA